MKDNQETENERSYDRYMFWQRVCFCMEIIAFATLLATAILESMRGNIRLGVANLCVVTWIVLSFMHRRDNVTYNKITRHALDGWKECIDQLGITTERAARYLRKCVMLQKTVRRTAHAMMENAELRRMIRKFDDGMSRAEYCVQFRLKHSRDSWTTINWSVGTHKRAHEALQFMLKDWSYRQYEYRVAYRKLTEWEVR